MIKCYGCLFKGEYQDMGASIPLCNRCNGFIEAIKEYEKSEPCKWYITRDEIIKLQNEGVIKLKPRINFDQITESVENLAEIMDNYRWCPYFSNSTCDSEIECKECIIEWLQKECEE